MAIYKYSETLLLEIYIYIFVLTPDLRTVFIYSATEFLHYSPTINLLLFLILINGYI